MSSLTRRIARKHRERGLRPDMNKQVGNSFYTCHPTKGWRKISMKRVVVNA